MVGDAVDRVLAQHRPARRDQFPDLRLDQRAAHLDRCLPAPAVADLVPPKIAFLPLVDVPDVEWGLVWRTAGETGRVREFAAAAR